MQLWFSRVGEVTIREQLVTQVILGILGNDLAPGERLPSTRELARRFRLHSNTISAGYRQLEREGWVEFRRGSGVYVRQQKPESTLTPELALDRLIDDFFRAARKLNLPTDLVHARLAHWLQMKPPDHFLLIEDDEELRAIVAAEIERAVTLKVRACGLQQLTPSVIGAGIPIALPSKAGTVRSEVPPGSEVITLQVRSVPLSLAGWLPAPAGTMVGVASRWPGFLKLARTMLVAAGFDADSLIFRDARKTNWRRGLDQTAAVICDTVTSARLGKIKRVIVFPLISETSLAELRHYQDFVSHSVSRSM